MQNNIVNTVYGFIPYAQMHHFTDIHQLYQEHV